MSLTNAYILHIAQATLGQSVTPFNSANAHLGVGNGTAAESPNHTDLQGSSKFRKSMDAGYPQLDTSSGVVMKFAATFGPSEANFSWNEYGIFNAASGGTMMLRKVQSFGTKQSNQAWRLEVTVQLTT